MENLQDMLLTIADGLPGDDPWSDDRIWLRWAVRLTEEKDDMAEDHWKRRWLGGIGRGQGMMAASADECAAHQHAYRAGTAYYESMDPEMAPSDQEKKAQEATVEAAAALAAINSPDPVEEEEEEAAEEEG